MEIQQFSRRMVELLPQLLRGFARHESNYLSRGKITLPQVVVLEYLARKPEGCPMNELAQFLSVSRPAVTGLVDRLLVQALVRRQEDPEDRRIVRVAITPKGRTTVAHIWEQKRRMLTKVFGKISPSDRAQYIATVGKVVRILSELKPL